MTRCRECDKKLIGNASRQEFCNDYCRGAYYHRRRYRQQAVEEAEERREAFGLAVMAGGLRSNERTQER